MRDTLEAVSSEAARIWKCAPCPGGVMIRTTCVHPSFEALHVYVDELGDGFIAHDAGDTAASMFLHGIDRETADRVILSECGRSGIGFEDGRIFWKFNSVDWLETAVIVVSNTAASAGRVATTFTNYAPKKRLKDKIFEMLAPEPRDREVSKDFVRRGESGRHHKFDLAVTGGSHLTLINAVERRATSVNSKYVSFSDVGGEGVRKIAVHNGDLRESDIALLGSVATVAEPSETIDLVISVAA